jgi:hypothetical protein
MQKKNKEEIEKIILNLFGILFLIALAILFKHYIVR